MSSICFGKSAPGRSATSRTEGPSFPPMDVEFRRVSLTRGGRPILREVSFSTAGTAVFLLHGPSGSGKTSLLRLVNRLDEADSGDVLVGGRSVRDYPPAVLRRQVGMIFQEPRLMEGTVEENVLFAARHHGIEVDLDGLLGRVGLGGMASRRVDGLSGGEQQRTAIARALAVRPSILLMDEPTSSLDEEAARGIERLLGEIVSSGGLRILFVTHSPGQLARLGGRGVLVSEGTVLRHGDLLAEEGA